MAEHIHDEDEHEHEHEIGCCADDHDHAPAGANEPLGFEKTDTASRSLANALRWSFALLTLIMVAVVGCFLFFGSFYTISNKEVGIKKLFGKITEVVSEPGLVFAWPFVGEIEKVKVTPQTVTIDDFWMNEMPEDKTQPDLNKRQNRQGDLLRSGWDGALFTGDRNLLHVRLTYTYDIRDARAFKQNVPEVAGVNIIFDPVTHDPQVVEPIRSAICEAAIEVAGAQTSENIRTQIAQFQSDVMTKAQEQLTKLNSGLRLTSVVATASYPLAVLPAFNAATAARNHPL